MIQFGPRALWEVRPTANRTNERVLNVIGGNPIHLDPIITHAVFVLQVTEKNNLDLTAVRIFGSVNRALGSTQFPLAGLAAEALVEWTTNPALNTAQARVPTLVTQGATRDTARLLPRSLLLEYTTANAGVGPVVEFVVWLQALQQEVTGADYA